MDRIVLELERMKHGFCGVGQYCLHLGKALVKELPAHNLMPVVMVHRKSAGSVPGASQFVWADWWRKEFVQQFCRCLPARYGQQDSLWHVTHHQSRFWPADASTPVLLTIQDLKFLQMSPSREIDRKLQQMQRIVDRVSAVATISESVRRDITSHLDLKGKPIRVIYAGVYESGSIPPVRPAWFHGRNFLFSIGVFERKKQFHLLVDMMEHLPELTLVLAGNFDSEYGRQVRELANSRPWRERIVFTGKISDAERQWFYDQCAAFVFPSIAEGFGLPVAEAMSAGCPVVLSNCTSLPEIGGDAAFYWDHLGCRHMAERVRDCITAYAAHPELRERLISQSTQFSWGAAARQYANWYREIIDAQRGADSRLKTGETWSRMEVDNTWHAVQAARRLA